MTEVVEQYKELCNTGRSIDTKLWSLPTAAFTFEALAIQGYLMFPSMDGRRFVATIAILILSGFLVQLIRFRGYQLNCEKEIKDLVKSKLPDFADVSQFAGLPRLPKNVFWLIRWIRFSSTTYMIIIMILVLGANVVALLKTF